MRSPWLDADRGGPPKLSDATQGQLVFQVSRTKKNILEKNIAFTASASALPSMIWVACYLLSEAVLDAKAISLSRQSWRDKAANQNVSSSATVD